MKVMKIMQVHLKCHHLQVCYKDHQAATEVTKRKEKVLEVINIKDISPKKILKTF